jgi:hypothetical protein
MAFTIATRGRVSLTAKVRHGVTATTTVALACRIVDRAIPRRMAMGAARGIGTIGVATLIAIETMVLANIGTVRARLTLLR